MTDDYLTEFFEGVVGVVEATSFEKYALWAFNKELREYSLPWQDNNSGYGITVGHIGKRPICISVLTAVIDGQKILFYSGMSELVHHPMIRNWMKNNMPKSAFTAGGRLNHSDAVNFHNVFRKVMV
jgi:hypothetical protein